MLNITGGDGGSSGHEPLVGTEVRVYDVSSGSCADQSGGTPKTYSTIYGDGTFANPGCVAETSGGTDLTGEITFPVEPGVYIVIGRPAPPHDDKLIGATVGIVGEGEVATKQIQLVVDGDGNEVGRFGEEGSGPGQFGLPTDVAIDAKGFIYVSEYGGNDRITKWSADLQFVCVLVSGEVAGQPLRRPAAVRRAGGPG